MVLSLIPKPKYEEEEAAVGLPRAQAVTDFSDGALAQDLPLTLPEKIMGKAVAIMTPPEGLPAPVKFLYRPILLGAVGLHALLFFAPMGGGHKAEKPAEKEKPLTITQVATGKAQPKLTKVPLSKLPPAIVKPTLPKLDRPSTPNAPVIKTPDAPTPPRTDTPPPAGATPQTPTPPANPSNVTPAPPGNAQTGDPFENFEINYPGATKPKAYYEASGVAPAAVESFFKGQSSKGFEIKDSGGTAARKVLTISKGGKTLYLGIFQDGSNTVYVQAGNESEIPATVDKVKGLKALPPGYDEIFKEESGADQGYPDNSYFDNHEPYLGSGSGNVLSLRLYKLSSAEVYPVLASSLQAMFKTVTPVPAGFNGGLLYKMTTTDGSEFYLNILDSKVGGGSIVATFQDLPELR
jgi:hypothetical protein